MTRPEQTHLCAMRQSATEIGKIINHQRGEISALRRAGKHLADYLEILAKGETAGPEKARLVREALQTFARTR